MRGASSRGVQLKGLKSQADLVDCSNYRGDLRQFERGPTMQDDPHRRAFGCASTVSTGVRIMGNVTVG